MLLDLFYNECLTNIFLSSISDIYTRVSGLKSLHGKLQRVFTRWAKTQYKSGASVSLTSGQKGVKKDISKIYLQVSSI